jgi:hypothetical protein
MRDFLVLLIHFLVTVIRLGRPGGLRSVVAESVLIRHQLLILNRGRKRAPNLRPTDRLLSGLCTLLMAPVPAGPFRHRSEAADTVASSRHSKEAQVSLVVLVQAPTATWP